MQKCIVPSLLALILVCQSPAAQAAVIPTFGASPSSLLSGESALLTLTLTAQADPGYFNARLAGGTVTLLAGDGRSETFAVTPGLQSQTFETSFVYGIAQSLSAAFRATVGLVQDYWRQVIVGWQPVGYWQSYRCGWFSTCSRWVQTGVQPIYGTTLDTMSYSSTLEGSVALFVSAPAPTGTDPAGSPGTVATAVPEPASLSIIGAALLGLAALRRRRSVA